MGATPNNISGSRSAAICGLSKWSTEVSVWLEIMEEREPGFCAKHGYEKPVKEESPFLTWGLAFEDAICQKIEEIESVKIVRREHEYSSDDGTQTCHVDGEVIRDVDILIENKTSFVLAARDEYGEEGSDIIPINYGVQVQHNMMLSGCKVCWLYVLVFPVIQTELDELVKLPEIDKKKWVDVLAEMGLFRKYIIHADPDIQSLLKPRYQQFWNENVLKKIPPTPVIMDDLRKLLPSKFGECIASPEIMHLVNTYRDISAEEGRVKPIKKNLRVKILDHMRTHATGGHNKNLRLLSENGHVSATYSKGRFTVRRAPK